MHRSSQTTRVGDYDTRCSGLAAMYSCIHQHGIAAWLGLLHKAARKCPKSQKTGDCGCATSACCSSPSDEAFPLVVMKSGLPLVAVDVKGDAEQARFLSCRFALPFAVLAGLGHRQRHGQSFRNHNVACLRSQRANRGWQRLLLQSSDRAYL